MNEAQQTASEILEKVRLFDPRDEYKNEVLKFPTGETIDKKEVFKAAKKTAGELGLTRGKVHDIVDAITILEGVVKGQEKIQPKSFKVQELEQAAKATHTIPKAKVKELVAKLSELERSEVVITRGSLDRVLGSGLADYQKQPLLQLIPQEPVLLSREVPVTQIVEVPTTAAPAPETPSAGAPKGPSLTSTVLKEGASAVGQGLLTKGLALAGGVPGKAASVILTNKRLRGALIGATIGVGAALGLGLSPVFGALGGGTIGAASGGAGGLSGAASSLGQGAMAVISGLGTATLGAFAIPLAVALIAVPIIVALILFIINSSAYLVPPGTGVIPGVIISPYIDVTKTVKPSQRISNDDLPATVEYIVKISAKKGSLTNIRVQNKYIVSASTAAAPNPPEDVLNSIPQTITTTDKYSFSYNLELGEEYKDSIITDTVTVTADSPEQQGAVASANVSLVIGTPQVDCPLPGGTITWGSYDNETTGHGSNAYWNAVGKTCSYALPQQSGCFAPEGSTENVCYGKTSCSIYGYAIDVFPSGTNDVFAPTINGESLEWEYNGINFSNGGGDAGYSYGYTDTTGKYSMLLTHIQNNPVIDRVVKSGDKIATLYPQGGNTHLHLEFQVDGEYQKPELFMCR